MRSKKVALFILIGSLLTACGSKPEEVSKIVPQKLVEISMSSESASEESTEESSEEAVVSEEPEIVEEPEEEKEVRITISAAGDTTLGNYVGQGYEWTFKQMWDEVQDPGYFFENVLPIFEADDLTIVNLEGPLTTATVPREGQTYSISGDPSYVQVLTNGSVEAVSMANNHRLDYFEQGSADTVAAVEEAGIAYAYDDKVAIVEIKGVRIGMVSVNIIGMGSGVEKYIQSGFEKLDEEGVDLKFVMCHWGIEREYSPEWYQRKLGKKCIDWGADLVIGHHPHVIQGIEEYQGKYIIYSLGNFCFGANKNPADKDCYIFQQTFVFEEGVRKEETEAKIIPCSISSQSGRNDYKPTPAEGEKATKILDRMKEYSKEFGITFDEEGNIGKIQ